MYILNQRKDEIIDSTFVERFRVICKDDAVTLIASYGPSRPPVTMGRYAERGAADAELLAIYDGLRDGDESFTMTASSC